jgi:hypothetical protein
MLSTDRVAVLIAGLTFLCGLMVTGIGLIVHVTTEWNHIEDQLGVMVDKLSEIAVSNRREHRAINRRIEKTDNRVERHEAWHHRSAS